MSQDREGLGIVQKLSYKGWQLLFLIFLVEWVYQLPENPTKIMKLSHMKLTNDESQDF